MAHLIFKSILTLRPGTLVYDCDVVCIRGVARGGGGGSKFESLPGPPLEGSPKGESENY